MKLRVYAYQRCDTCRRALRWLYDQGIEAEVLPIREQPPSRTELRRALASTGGHLRALFNSSGRDYRALGLKDRLPSLSLEEALDPLASNGNLVRRPFVVRGQDAWAGFDETEWRRRLGMPQG